MEISVAAFSFPENSSQSDSTIAPVAWPHFEKDIYSVRASAPSATGVPTATTTMAGEGYGVPAKASRRAKTTTMAREGGRSTATTERLEAATGARIGNGSRAVTVVTATAVVPTVIAMTAPVGAVAATPTIIGIPVTVTAVRVAEAAIERRPVKRPRIAVTVCGIGIPVGVIGIAVRIIRVNRLGAVVITGRWSIRVGRTRIGRWGRCVRGRRRGSHRLSPHRRTVLQPSREDIRADATVLQGDDLRGAVVITGRWSV